MTTQESYLTDEVKAMIGVESEKVEVSLWGIEGEGLRRFSQALMDPDPRFWDDDFARESRYGEIVTPAIFCSYLNKTPPGADDPITRAFRENPVSDGIGGVRGGRGGLPNIPTPLVRVLNAGNSIEVRKYPKLGDRVFAQSRYADIRERTGRDGSKMLIIGTETRYTDQDDNLLCITTASSFRR